MINDNNINIWLLNKCATNNNATFNKAKNKTLTDSFFTVYTSFYSLITSSNCLIACLFDIFLVNLILSLLFNNNFIF